MVAHLTRSRAEWYILICKSVFPCCSFRMLLWHGSRLTNWVGILSQGLRIAPPEAPVTGYMVRTVKSVVITNPPWTGEGFGYSSLPLLISQHLILECTDHDFWTNSCELISARWVNKFHFFLNFYPSHLSPSRTDTNIPKLYWRFVISTKLKM